MIRNKLFIDLKTTPKKYLLINTLYGLVDIISHQEYSKIIEWDKVDIPLLQNQFEMDLYNKLKSRFYFLTDSEELRVKNDIISKRVQPLEQQLFSSKSASFIFSYDCNFKCPYCYEKGHSPSENMMTKEMIDKVISFYVDGIDHIGFFGGEPLLPQNIDLISYVVKKVPDAYYTIITNGYHLDYYLPILRKIRVAMLQITLDGTKEQHNKTRILKNGEQTYDKIVENIKLCLEQKIPIKIRMNVSEENIEDCYNEQKELTRLFGENSVFFELQPLFNYSYQKQNCIIEQMRFNELSDNAQNIIWHTLPPLSNFIFNHKPLRPIIKFCDSESQNRFFDCNGDIYSCILSVGERNKSIGKYYPKLDIKKDSIFTYNITTNEKCSKCNYSLICGGGCPYHVMDEKGSILCPNCFNLKNEIDYIIPTLYKQLQGD